MRVEKTKLNNVIDNLKQLYKKQKFKCVSCGKQLNFRIQFWWQDNGHAWLYIPCSNCYYDNAVWKILKLQFQIEKWR